MPSNRTTQRDKPLDDPRLPRGPIRVDPRWLYEIQRGITQARLDQNSKGLAELEMRIAQRLQLALEDERE